MLLVLLHNRDLIASVGETRVVAGLAMLLLAQILIASSALGDLVGGLDDAHVELVANELFAATQTPPPAKGRARAASPAPPVQRDHDGAAGA